ncbi:hypothetical protein MKX08_001974 [Trichoderma sp. CBMAI-0020]|nr:hypothetical protein MKX08_001974 [Trichoderma sp. CBMAI-0020]
MALDMQAIGLAQCGFLPDDLQRERAHGHVLAGGMGSGGGSSKQNDGLGDLLEKYSPAPLAL